MSGGTGDRRRRHETENVAGGVTNVDDAGGDDARADANGDARTSVFTSGSGYSLSWRIAPALTPQLMAGRACARGSGRRGVRGGEPMMRFFLGR